MILSIPIKELEDESQTKKPQHRLQGQGECRKRPLNCSTLRWRERKRRPPVNTRFFGMVVINLAPNWLVGRTSIDLSLRGPRSWEGWYWRGRVWRNCCRCRSERMDNRPQRFGLKHDFCQVRAYRQPAGLHLQTWQSSSVAAGVYLITLESETSRRTNHVVLSRLGGALPSMYSGEDVLDRERRLIAPLHW